MVGGTECGRCGAGIRAPVEINQQSYPNPEHSARLQGAEWLVNR